jgi:hypothetical protein
MSKRNAKSRWLYLHQSYLGVVNGVREITTEEAENAPKNDDFDTGEDFFAAVGQHGERLKTLVDIMQKLQELERTLPQA